MCLLIQICGEEKNRKFEPKQCIVYGEEKCEVHWPVGQERSFFRWGEGEVVLREAKTTWAELFSFREKSLSARARRSHAEISSYVDLTTRALKPHGHAQRGCQIILLGKCAHEDRARRAQNPPTTLYSIFPPTRNGVITYDNAGWSVVL